MRLFLHMVRDEERIDDVDGVDAADIQDAIRHAAAIVSEISADGEAELSAWQGWSIEGATDGGAILFRILIAAAPS